MEYQVNKPYPKVEVEKENKEYAYLLLEDYAGVISEDTAIHQYSYQHFDQFNIDTEFSEALSRIAMTEMKHLNLLGKTIKLLGVDPKFIFVEKNENCPKYWKSNFVNYTTNLKAMLIDDIKIEKEAIKAYQKHIQMIDDRYIKQLLERIIEDEEQHIKCFNELLERCKND